MRIRRSQSGISSAEIIVAMGLTLMVTGAGLGFYRSESHAVKEIAARQQARDTLRAAIEMMSGEIRRTGYDPSGAAFAAGASGITRAERWTVQVDRDVNGDGTIDAAIADPNAERILYTYHFTSREIRRTVAGVTRTLVENVPPDGLRFEYFDSNGSLLNGSGWLHALDADDRADVRMVRVRLQVNAVGIVPTRTFNASQRVALSNRIPNAF